MNDSQSSFGGELNEMVIGRYCWNFRNFMGFRP